jgi:hypothetical protein
MANIHYLKRSHNEAVVKMYSVNASGETIDLALSTLATDDETFDANNAIVTVKEIYWGAKKDKQIDLTRWDGVATHGHYYLLGAGHYNYVGFTDDVYSERDLRAILDGPGHVIIKLTKVSGYTN